MHEMSIFWLRVAVGLYAFGLLDTFWRLLRRNSPITRYAFGVFGVAVILHFVSLLELALAVGHLPAENFQETISLCAFLIALTFLAVNWRYDFASLSIFVFPLVFVMGLVAAMQTPVSSWADPRLRDAWLLVHVALVLVGYAALLLTAFASIFYLIEERRLKSKRPKGFFERLPPLGTLDVLITRSMEIGFVFITLALVAGAIWAFIESGTRWIAEAKIVISLVTWVAYLAIVFLRTSAGWRGRKAAVMVLGVVGCSALTWAAHIGLRPLLAP